MLSGRPCFWPWPLPSPPIFAALCARTPALGSLCSPPSLWIGRLGAVVVAVLPPPCSRRSLSLALSFAPCGVPACLTLRPFSFGTQDFGLAKRVPRKTGANQQYIMTSKTGTIRYMAPEVRTYVRSGPRVSKRRGNTRCRFRSWPHRTAPRR